METNSETNPSLMMESVLVAAVQTDDTDMLNEVIKFCDLTTINKVTCGMTALCVACSRCCYDNVKILIEAGADVNERGSNGMSALHFACRESRAGVDDENSQIFDIIDLLLNSGALIDGFDDLGRTSLIIAGEVDNHQIVRHLISRGCDVNEMSLYEESAMTLACRNAEVMFSRCGSQSSSEYQAKLKENPSFWIARMLINADINNGREMLLPTAVRLGYEELVTELLDSGIDVNYIGSGNFTFLGLACATAKVPSSIVKVLLEHGANVNKAGVWEKQKPIISAYVHNSVDKMRLLLSYGATITSEEMTNLVSVTLSKYILENPEVVRPDSNELLPWRLLLSNGFRPLFQGILLNKIQQLRMCSSYSSIASWIKDLLYPNPTLKDRCRRTIRDSISPCKDVKIEELPLPKSVISYLQFDEF